MNKHLAILLTVVTMTMNILPFSLNRDDPSFSPCSCDSSYYMFDSFEDERGCTEACCYLTYVTVWAYCRNCGHQWVDAYYTVFQPHDFAYGRCNICGYLQ